MRTQAAAGLCACGQRKDTTLWQLPASASKEEFCQHDAADVEVVLNNSTVEWLAVWGTVDNMCDEFCVSN